jgi:AP-4 complex subunit beta-1
MTLGIDVSRLFTDMIMVRSNGLICPIDHFYPQFCILQAIETKDIVIKKMVYFYLCNYAHSEPEMAIMCINSLRRDW